MYIIIHIIQDVALYMVYLILGVAWHILDELPNLYHTILKLMFYTIYCVHAVALRTIKLFVNE